jgi:hypothetical protein
MRRVSPLLTPAIVLAALATDVSAQVRAAIAAAPSCEACSVRATPIVRLGSDTDPAGFAPLVQVAMAAGPRYYVSSSTFTGEVYVYDSAGKFLKAIGRRGQGPGEFSRPVNLSVAGGDTVIAIEQGSNRYHVIAPGGEIVRSSQLRDPVNAFAAMRDGSLFLAAKHGNAGVITTLARTDRNREIIAAFEPTEAGARTSGRQFVAVDNQGEAWSLNAERLRLIHWGSANQPVAIFEGKRDWFTEGIPPQGKNPMQVKPVAWMGGLGFVAGKVLVYYLVPDANWAPMTGPLDLRRIYDTRVEVIDPASGALYAASNFDDVMMPMQNDVAYTLVEVPSGDMRVELRRLSIREH